MFALLSTYYQYLLQMNLYFLFVLFVSALTFGQDSKNISLLDQWQNNNLEVNSTKVRYNECWGFVYDSQEYAILGSTEATHFFKLTDANKLIEVLKLSNYVKSCCKDSRC